MGLIPRTEFTVTRFGAGSRDKGRWVEDPTPSTFQAKYSYQPMRGRDMLLLPENRRNTQAYWLFGDTKLRPADPVTQTNADRIEIESEMYEILGNAPWNNNIINHQQIMAVKL